MSRYGWIYLGEMDLAPEIIHKFLAYREVAQTSDRDKSIAKLQAEIEALNVQQP